MIRQISPNCLFENTVGRRIGNHQRPERIGVLLGLGAQVGHVDVAFVVASDHHDFHSSHIRAGRIGAVGRRWNQTHVAAGIAAVLVILANRQQTRVLALGTGIGLQGHSGKTCQLAEHGLEPADELVSSITTRSGVRAPGRSMGPIRPR